jgi:hypothetical protein
VERALVGANSFENEKLELFSGWLGGLMFFFQEKRTMRRDLFKQ